MINNLVVIGKTGRPHGLNGELKLFVNDHIDEDDVLAAKTLFISLRSQPLPYFVEFVRGGGNLILKLEGISTRDAASALQHADVYLPEDALSAIEEEENLQQWVGITVVDTEMGVLGPITQVIEMPQHVIAEIDYQGKKVLIPLHEDLITDMNPDAKTVTMDLPQGLVE